MIFDDLTDSVFNAILIDEDWNKALKLMSDAADGATLFLTNGVPDRPESFRTYTANYDYSVHQRSGFSFESQFDPNVNSSIPAAYAAPVGITFDRRSYCPDDVFLKDPFYNAVMLSQDLFHTRLIKLEHKQDVLSGGYISVPEKRGPIEGDLLQLVESWLPTIRAILRMEAKFRADAGIRQGLQSAIDQLNHGVVVVDRSLKVLSVNPEADRIFRTGDALSNVQGRLRLNRQALHRRLSERVHDVAAWTRGRPAETDTFVVPDSHGTPAYEITVLPAEGIGQTMSISAGVATVVIEDLFRMRDLPSIDTLRARFGLTLMQARVTQLALLPFSSKREIAEKLGVAESTVRSHLAAARQIVGGQNLHEFVQLASGLRWRGGP